MIQKVLSNEDRPRFRTDISDQLLFHTGGEQAGDPERIRFRKVLIRRCREIISNPPAI